MRVICRKLISATTGQDLGELSPWLIKDKEYIVLALNYTEFDGLYICIQTENFNEPHFISVKGFEFVDQKIPTSWITVFSEIHGRKEMNVIPMSWNYDSFYEDLDDGKSDAVAIFNQEAEKIYQEENAQ